MVEMARRYFWGCDGETVDSDKAFEFATEAAKEGDGQGDMPLLGGATRVAME